MAILSYSGSSISLYYHYHRTLVIVADRISRMWIISKVVCYPTTLTNLQLVTSRDLKKKLQLNIFGSENCNHGSLFATEVQQKFSFTKSEATHVILLAPRAQSFSAVSRNSIDRVGGVPWRAICAGCSQQFLLINPHDAQ